MRAYYHRTNPDDDGNGDDNNDNNSDCNGTNGMDDEDRPSSRPNPPVSHDDNSSAAMETPRTLYRFDEIWILPVYRHTFRDKQRRLVSFEHRLRMCELAFLDQESGNTEVIDKEAEGGSTRGRSRPPVVVVSEAERDSWQRAAARQQKSTNPAAPPASVGTAALMEYLDEAHPDGEFDFSFCLGEDAYRDLVAGKWKEGDRVLRRFRNRLYVVPRSGGKDPPQGDNDNDGQSLLQLHGARWLRVPGATTRDVVVSSSRVRAMATTAEPGDGNAELMLLDWVSPAVLDYVKEHRLYGFHPGRFVTY